MTTVISDSGVVFNGVAATGQKIPITCTQASGALTITIPAYALTFRSATLSDGTATTINSSIVTTLVVPSGGTLGILTTLTGRLIVAALNNAGTVELMVMNLAGGLNTNGTNLVTTTAISASSTSNATWYSTTARTGVAYEVIGFVDVVNTTGAYSTPSQVQGSGGQALMQLADARYSIASVAVPGMRNRVINGAMNIDQRNSGAAVTNPGGATLDRFACQNTTGTGTLIAQQSTMTGFGHSLRSTATVAITALTTNLYVRSLLHVIEAQNCFDLNSKTVTVSFKAETNWTGNLAVAIVNSAVNRSYVINVAVVSGINTCVVTLPLEATTVAANDTTVGLGIDIGFCNQATYQTATTGIWQAGNFYTSTTSTQWCTTAGNFVNITQVQLEQGAVATPFEQRPIGVELALCQRYYQIFRSHILSSSYAVGAYASSRTNFEQTMRTTPTLASVLVSSYNNSAPSTAHITLTGATVYVTTLNISTVVEYIADFTATAEYY